MKYFNYLSVILCLLFISLYSTATSQCTVTGSNLIPNSGFENTSGCSSTVIYYDSSPLVSWIGCDDSGSGCSTADLAHATNTSSGCGVSVNSYNSNCASGDRKVGLFVYNKSFFGREYIQTALTTTLTAGVSYCFHMTVRSKYGSVGQKQLNTDGIGAHFYGGPFINFACGPQDLGPGSAENRTPQVEQPNGSIITNTCTIVQGTFVADGTEDKVIIGNFKSDANTTWDGSSTASYVYLDDVALYEVSVVLPVELMYFDVKCIDNKFVEISWETATEVNNDYFTLEKSIDGLHYEVSQIVNGAGNSNQINHYSVVDYSPNYQEATYYRLKQTDYNGSFKYYEPKAIQCQNQLSDIHLNVHANPISNELNFTVSSPLSGTLNIMLMDCLGRVIINQPDNIEKGNTKLNIKTNHLSKGVYFLTAVFNNQQYIPSIKIVKQ
ncbi:MAG: T9SS type A sorting domain-containing protein [Flavobacteriales bacterium]